MYMQTTVKWSTLRCKSKLKVYIEYASTKNFKMSTSSINWKLIALSWSQTGCS